MILTGVYCVRRLQAILHGSPRPPPLPGAHPALGGATITLPGETEAGNAGMQPCRGIAWWAHRDDDWSAEAPLLRSSKKHIGSVDPNASKIPARRAEFT